MTPVNYIVNTLFESWAALGVYIFVVISCYFLCDGNGIHSKKAVYIYLQTFFISVTLCILFKVFNIENFGIRQILVCVLTPIYQGSEYWFIRVYLSFYLLVPILQKIVKTCDENQLEKIFIILTIIIQLLKFIFFQCNAGLLGDFIYIFFSMAYLKRANNNIIEKSPGVFVFLLCILNSIGLFCFKILNKKYGIPDLSGKFIGHELPSFFLAISLFYFSKKYWNFQSNHINAIAKTTFGIYILHEAPLFYINKENPFLFSRILKIGEHESSPYYIFYLIGMVFLVFFVCSVLEYCRSLVFEKHLLDKDKVLNNLCNTIDSWYKL